MDKIKFLALFLTFGAALAQTPPITDNCLAEAKAKAAAEQKTIFLHFGASWCGWCKRLDQFIEQKDIHPILREHFVLVKLTVKENEKNKALENAGADSLLSKLGGATAGLPFFVFLDAKGKIIVDSKRSGSAAGHGIGEANIGFPSQPEEIAWFMTMLKKAAPKITAHETKTIEDHLKK